MLFIFRNFSRWLASERLTSSESPKMNDDVSKGRKLLPLVVFEEESYSPPWQEMHTPGTALAPCESRIAVVNGVPSPLNTKKFPDDLAPAVNVIATVANGFAFCAASPIDNCGLGFSPGLTVLMKFV